MNDSLNNCQLPYWIASINPCYHQSLLYRYEMFILDEISFFLHFVLLYYDLLLGTFSWLRTYSSSEVSHRNIFLCHFFLSDSYFFIVFLMRFHFLDLTFKKFKSLPPFSFLFTLFSVLKSDWLLQIQKCNISINFSQFTRQLSI